MRSSMEDTGFSSPLRPFLTIILRRRFFLSAMGILFLKRARDKFEKFVRLTRGRASRAAPGRRPGAVKKEKKNFCVLLGWYSEKRWSNDGAQMARIENMA